MSSNASSVQTLQAKIDAMRLAHGLEPVKPVVDEPLSPVPEEAPEELGEPVDVKAMLEEHEQLSSDVRVLKRVGSYVSELRSLMQQSSIPAVEKKYYFDRLDAIIPDYYDVVDSIVASLNELESLLALHSDRH